jgi:pyruvate kinase
MSSTCLEAESVINYDANFAAIRTAVLSEDGKISPTESVASSAVKTARDVEAAAIVVLTESGSTARLIAKYRPGVPIVAITPSQHVARQVQGYVKNVFAKVVPPGLEYDQSLALAIEFAQGHGWVHPGDSVVYVHGVQKNIAGSTNILQIITV